jgi:hypothetical protein
MTIRRYIKTVAGIAALSVLVTAGTSAAAADPAVTCAATVAKSVSKCIKKAAGTRATCYKKAGADCSNDEKVRGAYDKASAAIISKCDSDATVVAAGYAETSTRARSNLSKSVADLCRVHAQNIVERTFGEAGSEWTAADDDEKKCLQTAAKVSTKYLTKAVGALSKCVEVGCSFDTSAAAADAAESIDSKCSTFATLYGASSTAYIAEATSQITETVASPCDPIDTGRCAFPFVNDYYAASGSGTESNKRIALTRGSLPATDASPAIAVDPTRWSEADGWSIGPMLLFSNPDIDLVQTGAAPLTDLAKSLEANTPVAIIDAETGAKQLLWVERDERGSTIDDQPLIIRVGKNLKEGHRYIVALRNMKDSMGATIEAPDGFKIYRDNLASDLLPVEARRADMEEILTTLTSNGFTRSELYLAWDFTTQSSDSVRKRMLKMRDDSFTALGAASPAFTVDSVVEDLGDTKIFRTINGTFQAPLYLTGTGAPYTLGNTIPSSYLRLDANGMPVSSGTVTVPYRCLIPRSADNAGTANPARISLYGHGLLGNYTEVSAGNVKDMANEHNMVFCATFWTGFDTNEGLFVLEVLKDFTRFPAFIDRQHQGMLNMMYLGRAMKAATGFSSNLNFQIGGQSALDTSDLFYDGNSQGGILGGVLAAFHQEATRFSLGVPGINYSTLLNRSTDFEEFDVLLTEKYPSSADRNILLSLAQQIWDRTDPNGHIHHVIADPYPGTPVKKALYQIAYGDHQVAPVTIEVAARTNGMPIHTPVLGTPKQPDVTPYYDIPAISYSAATMDVPYLNFDGSAMVIWDSGNPPPPLGNTSPAVVAAPPLSTCTGGICDGGLNAGNACSGNYHCPLAMGSAEWEAMGDCPKANGSDPHSCPRKNATARIQKSHFLRTGGTIADVCSGAACWAN